MNAVTEFLYPAPAQRRVWRIIQWWESRRLHYNLAVGATGLVSLGALRVLTLLPPDAPSLPFFLPGILVPVIAYGAMANVCYSLGPTAEILIEKLSGGKILPTGPALYRMGLTFSVGLTLLPTLLAGMEWVGRVLGWIF